MNDFEAAGRLIDRQIEDTNGALVGRVDDLVIDVSSGQIEYVRICVSSQDSVKQDSVKVETITVPWSLITASTRKRNRWRVGVEKTVLQRVAAQQQRR